MHKALTIAGSDSSGGAGIQADLKTFMAHKVYGMSVITAITAQNTCGVFAVQEIESDMVAAQLDAIFTDIKPDAIKIGMLASKKIIETVAEKLNQYHAKNIVLDPVMVSTSGRRLLNTDAQSVLMNELMPMAKVITPNIPEAEVWCGFTIKSKEMMTRAAVEIAKYYKGNILIKGGHLSKDANDLLYKDGQTVWFQQKRIHTNNTHGTGCALSSAIASNLAAGLDVHMSVENAKSYVYQALKANLDLGKGNGPIDHGAVQL